MVVTDSITGASRIRLSTRAGALSGRDERAVNHVEILDLNKALELVSEEWLALEQQSEQANVFQSVAWATAVHRWLRLNESSDRDRDHQVVISRNKDGNLTGVWPIQVERCLGRPFVVALGEPFGQYGDILIAPEVERAAVVDAMVIALQSLDRFSGVLLRKVRDDARCVSRVSELGQVLKIAKAPAVDLRDYESFAVYHKTVKAKTRKNLRNARNRLERDNVKLTHVVHRDVEALSLIHI